MKVKLVAGIKFDKLPNSVIDEDGEFIESDDGIKVFPDCYSGEWSILGIELCSSQDTRHDELDFYWDITKYDNYIKLASIAFKDMGIKAEPRILCFTYYT